MRRQPSSARDKLFSHAVLFVACVVFPAAFTWIAPVSWSTLTRHGNRVEARVKVCLLFFIPFRTDELADVKSVDHHVRAGVRERLNIGDADDRKREITTESEGSLVLHGTDKDLIVHVSPASLESVSRDVREFLNDTDRAALRFFAPANWKASFIAGGAVCLLTVLYLFVIVTSLLWRPSSKASVNRAPAQDGELSS
jgi:hypothetical protein